MQDAKEEIRARLNIEDVVGEYVQLKRAGRNFKGLSPFTSEKTPSFVVSPEKAIWHDFSSGKGGDVFAFIMEVEGVDFRAALEQLARKAGVDLGMYDSKGLGELAKKKKRLLEANELAARYFQQSLLKNTHALEYIFKKRRLNKEIVQEFRIGYAPNDGEALVRLLIKKGFTKNELSDAGLTNRFGGDIFRGRMTIPLMDGSGQVVGFTGRILQDVPNAPKYLNTPATLIYDKSRHVFGLSQAKQAIRKSDRVVMVEGNLDVVASYQAGVAQVVATAGTAMTEWHLKALQRLTHNITLAFDRDAAGLAATLRAIPIAQKIGVDLSILRLPEGVKDPDELVQQDVNAWRRVISEAEPVMDWAVAEYAGAEDMTSAAGKRRFTSNISKLLQTLIDPVEREHYLRKVASLAGTSLESLQNKLINTAEDKTTPRKQIKNSSENSAPTFNAFEDALLGILYFYPKTRPVITESHLDLFTDGERRTLAKYLQTHLKPTTDLPKELQQIETYVRIVELKAETRYGAWDESDISLEAARLLRQLEIEHKKKLREQLIAELREAEDSGDESLAVNLRTQLASIIKETARE